MNATSTATEPAQAVIQVHSVTETRPGLFCFSDEFQHRLVFVDQASGVTRTVGAEGTEPGLFRYPSGLVFWQDALYVADTWNHRVQVLDAEGTPQAAFGSYGAEDQHFDCPLDLMVSPDGDFLWVLDSGNHEIKVFDRSHALVGKRTSQNLSLKPNQPGAALALQANPDEKARTFHYPRRFFFAGDRWLVLDNHGGFVFEGDQAVRCFDNLFSCYLKPLCLHAEWALFYYSVDHSLRALDFSGAFDETLQTLPADTATVFVSEGRLWRCDTSFARHELAWPQSRDFLTALPETTTDTLALMRLIGETEAADQVLAEKGLNAQQAAFLQHLDAGKLTADDAPALTTACESHFSAMASALQALQALPVCYLPHIRPYGPMSVSLSPTFRLKNSYLTHSAAQIFDQLNQHGDALAALTAAMPADSNALNDGFWSGLTTCLMESAARFFVFKKDAYLALHERVGAELAGVTSPKTLKASLQTDFWLSISDDVHRLDAVIFAVDQALALCERLLADWRTRWSPAEAAPTFMAHIDQVNQQGFALSNHLFDACRATEPLLQQWDALIPQTHFSPATLPYYAAGAWAGQTESWTVDQVERARARVCSVAANHFVFLAQQRFLQPLAPTLYESFVFKVRFSLLGVGSFLARCGQSEALATVINYRDDAFFGDRFTHLLEMAGIKTLCGDFDRARHFLRQWLKPESGSAAWLHLAFLEACGGEQSQARAIFSEHANASEHPLYYGRAAPFLDEPAPALAAIEAGDQPTSLDLFLVQCGLHSLHGAAEQALHLVEQHGDQPAWARALCAAGALWRLGRSDEALTRLQLIPVGASLWLDTRRAALLRLTDADDQAAALLDAALALRPGFVPMQIERLLLHLKAGDEEAVAGLLAVMPAWAWVYAKSGPVRRDSDAFLPLLRAMMAAEKTPKTWGENANADAVALYMLTVHPMFRST